MSLVARVQRRAESVGALLPADTRVRVERRLRGWFEARRLKKADVAVVSFGKSGRTWLRVMLSRYWQQQFALPEGELLEYDNFHRRAPAVPRVLFTHDNYLGDYSGERESKRDYARHRVVLLVRDPADIAVSQYFQWRHRMRDHKKRLNGYPLDESMSMFDFVMGEAAGLPKIVRYLNQWLLARDNIGDLLTVRYEDLRADTEGQLRRVLEFVSNAGDPVTDSAVAEAVEYASYENMRAREAGESSAGGTSERLRAADPANPDSFKTRRGKVGGYRDYFDDSQIEAIDKLIARTLVAELGYNDRPALERPAAAGEELRG